MAILFAAACLVGLAFGGAVLAFAPLLAKSIYKGFPGHGPAGASLLAWFLLKRRDSEFRKQLPAGLISLATSVRAGLSLPQAIEAAGKSLGGPLGEEFRSLVREMEHGGSLDQALRGLERRTSLPEIKFMVAGLRVARASGGGLAPLLERLADTMREREELRGQIKSLTAQGRLSGWVVGSIPVALLVGIALIDPGFVRPLFVNPLGWLFLVLAGLLELAGILVIRAVVRIEP